MRPPSCSARARGVTLIELLVAVALAALLALAAVPTFRELAANARRDARLQELRGALLVARSEALARGRAVVVCASTTHTSCGSGARWTDGWTALARSTATEAPVALAGAGADPTTWIHATRDAIEFLPSSIAAATATLTVCDSRGARAARSLVISRTGRIRTANAGAGVCG